MLPQFFLGQHHYYAVNYFILPVFLLHIFVSKCRCTLNTLFHTQIYPTRVLCYSQHAVCCCNIKMAPTSLCCPQNFAHNHCQNLPSLLNFRRNIIHARIQSLAFNLAKCHYKRRVRRLRMQTSLQSTLIF